MPRQNYKRRDTKLGFQGGFKASGYGLALQANSKANFALSQLNAEKKQKDTSGSVVTSATGSITLLNGLVQGNTVSTRVGNSVRFKNLAIRAAVANATAETIWLRYLIVRSEQPNGVAPTITQILQSANVQSFRNLNNVKRFTILKDKVLPLPYEDAATGMASNPRFIEHYIDLEKRAKKKRKDKSANETDYGLGNAGTIADISVNAYYLVVFSSAVTNQPLFSYESRMRYVDN